MRFKIFFSQVHKTINYMNILINLLLFNDLHYFNNLRILNNKIVFYIDR